MPRTSRIWRITSTGTTAAPVTDERTLDRSKLASSGWLMMVWKTVGGPGSIVMRSSATSAITVGTSNTACGMIVAPFSTHASTPDFNPAVWKNG